MEDMDSERILINITIRDQEEGVTVTLGYTVQIIDHLDCDL